MILLKFKQKFSTLRKVLSFVYGRYPVQAFLRDFLFVVSTFSEIYGITVLGRFIDETTKILSEWNEFDLVTYFSSESFLYLALILVLWIVVMMATNAREYLYNVIYERVWEDSQYSIISKVSTSNLHDVEKKEFQDMLTYAPAFSINRIILSYDNFAIILSNTFRMITSLVIIYKTMGLSVLVLLFFVLPEVLAVHLRRKGIRSFQDEVVGKIRFLNYIQNIALTISNFLELRVNNVYSYLRRKYISEYDQYLSGYLETQLNFYRDKASASIFGQIFKYAYIVYLLAVSVTKGVSFGTFKALYDYVHVTYDSAFQVLNSLSLISTNLGYIDKYFDLMEYEGFGDHKHGEVKLSNHTPKLEFKNLSFAYPDDPGTKVLKSLNIEVNPGEKVAFFGGDGSGKSSTVKVLTGLYPIESGEYLLDGHSTKDLDRGELKRKLAVIFQDFINYHFSVKENVVISGQRKDVDSGLYDEVSKIAEIDKFMKIIHAEDNSLLGKTFSGGKDLSPGYWQRLAIARMLYRNKRIFIMDEPFTFIDDITAERILGSIFNFIGDNKSLIYITRSINLLNRFDKIYYFEKGKIVESGSWKELMKSKGLLYSESKLQGYSEKV